MSFPGGFVISFLLKKHCYGFMLLLQVPFSLQLSSFFFRGHHFWQNGGWWSFVEFMVAEEEEQAF